MAQPISSGFAFHKGFAPLLISVVTLTGCGGGGGGGGGVDVTDDPLPPMPSRVEYVAGGPGGDPSTTGLFLQDGVLAITSTFYLQGTYTPATKTYSLTQSPVPRFVVNPSGLDFNLAVYNSEGGFGLLVDESLEWVYGEHPTSGEFRAISGNSIRVKVNNDIDQVGTAGVDISMVEFGTDSESVSMSWDEFDAVFENPAAPSYQRQAALAYRALNYLYTPLNRVVENFGTLRSQETTLEATGSGQSVTAPLCTTFNGIDGSFSLTWSDGTEGIVGSMGSSDSFTVAFANCWVDDSATNSDLLYDSGRIELKTFGESTTPFVLGFDDVVFNELQITPTEQSGAGEGTTGSSTVYNTFSSVAGRDGFYFELTPDVSGTLNLVNVSQVASATASSITTPSELGNFGANMLEDVLAGTSTSGTNVCPVSGSYDYLLSHYPFTSGATMDVTFHDCVQGSNADRTAVNGGYTLTATAYTSTDDMGFNLAVDNVVIQDDVGTRTIDGKMHFSRSVVGASSNEVTSSISGQSLDISQAGITGSLTNFSFTGTRTSTGITLGIENEVFTLQLSTFSEPLSGVITNGFSGTGITSLDIGALQVSASDDSNFSMTITDTSGTVTIALDSDGNGSAEDVITTNWDDLF